MANLSGPWLPASGDPKHEVGGLSRRQFVKTLAQSGLLVGGGSSLIAACGSSSSSSAAAARGVPSGTITLLHEGAADIAPIITGVVHDFERTDPHIHVKDSVLAGGGTTGNWAQYSDSLTTQIAGGNIPDVVWMATEGMRVFWSKGLLTPLDAYIHRDQAQLKSYFASLPRGLLDQWNKLVSPDGHQYQLPIQFNTMGIWYNTNVFAEARVPEPNPDWTWADFLDIAKKLTKPGKVFGMQVTNTTEFIGVMPWLLTNGASPLNADWTKATIDTPQAVEAATFMRSLVEQGISPEPGGQFDPIAAMAQGKLAMFGAGWWPLLPARQQGLLPKVKIVPWPTHRGGRASPVGWNMYPIFKASHNKAAAWEFVKYMTEPSVSSFISTKGATLPLSSNIAAQVIKTSGPPGSHYLYEALEYSTPTPSPNQNAVVEQNIENTFGQILAGNVKPASALSTLNGQIQAQL